MMSNVEDIAKIALLGARDCLEGRNFGRAFANLLLFLKLKPDRSVEVYSDFSFATREWFEQLERQNRLDDLFKCYDQACELFPCHDAVLSFIGTQLFRLGFVEKAAMYIRKSLSLNPDDLLARNNLENVCSHLVERWHFSMLNDKRRNMAFKCAIDKAVKSGYNTVLDVGTGTGILSMMAEMSGSVHVVACDGSHSMVDIAESVFDANGVSNKINLLYKHSTDLQIPHHIPSRVKLLVTEIFDAGLFGEHIVTTMIHAWKNLISTSPMGTVIPCGATVYVCGIESETIRQQSRFMYPVLQYLDVSHVELLCNTGHTAEDPYTTENLAKIRGGYKILTNITELLRVNFCNLWELESLNAGRDWICDLYVKQSGRLDALAVWFDLHLDDTVTIETGPLNESCWQQVIYPISSVSKSHANNHESCHVKKRDRVRASFHFGCDCLTLTDCNIRNQHIHKTSKPCTTSAVNPRMSQTSAGTSVDECSTHCLPFRKRKVDTIESCELLNQSDNELGLCPADNVGKVNKENVILSNECDVNDASAVNDVNDINDACDVNDCLDAYQSSHLDASNLIHCANTTESNVDKDSFCAIKLFGDTTDEIADDKVGSTAGNTADSIADDTADGIIDNITHCIVDNEAHGIVVDTADGITDDTVDAVDCLNDGMETCLINCKISSDQIKDSRVVEKLGQSGKTNVFCDAEKKLNSSHAHMLAADYSLNEFQKLTLYADEVDIEYVNDIHLNRTFCNTLVEMKSASDTSELSLLCISSRLSFLGVQATVIGYTDVTIATPEEHHETINQVALLNGCDDIILTKISDLDDLDAKFDVIICDIVESCGALLPRIFENMAGYRFSHLKTSGKLFPSKVKIHGMFIESEELETRSHVTGNDKTLGFQIAEFINVYQMQTHVDIDLATLNFTRLTEVQEMLTLDFDELSTETTRDFLTRSVEKSLHVTTSGKASAFVYWFELILKDNTVINTLSTCYHWKQAGIMMSDDVTIETGQVLVTRLKLENSFLDVKVLRTQSCNGYT